MTAITPSPFNSREQIQQPIQDSRISWGWPLLMLPSRFLMDLRLTFCVLMTSEP
jgi:hypothetical protein